MEGLSHASMELRLLHLDFAHHLKPEKADQEAQLPRVIQMLAVEELPQNIKPKRVQFRSPQGQSDVKMLQVVNGIRQKIPISKKTKWLNEPNHISESYMSNDEEEEDHPLNRSK
jgi:hypothetical protein